ncbi:uncharacterized protein LOC130735183 [Lotus japonicus]|uniref:uncharacterized protein LOC130735183 n=1 Tax=Lotus japonicus TaxID=34305 RepID=UPI0025881255|nr:uncharacterized protein LOC130735183 [Lotus japonicus]
MANENAPCDLETKREVWRKLLVWKQFLPAASWCIGGDFNAVWSSAERRGDSISPSYGRREMEDYNQFIFHMELVDIPIIGKRFTWFRPNGNSMSRLDRLQAWNKEVFGDLKKQKKVITEEMENIDKKNEVVGLSEVESLRSKELLGDLCKVSKLNESIMCQKARSRWLKEGDRNTKFFHSCVNWRRRTNNLVGLSVNGIWEEEPENIRREVKIFFESRFKEVECPSLNLDGVPFSSISCDDNALLCDAFDPRDIKAAVWDCEGDKSLGPDGFNFKFIKELWHLMHGDIQRVLNEFHANSAWLHGSNSSFALIPKCDSLQGLNDYRLISLVGCMYKIVAEMLANRLKEVLHKVIGAECKALNSFCTIQVKN